MSELEKLQLQLQDLQNENITLIQDIDKLGAMIKAYKDIIEQLVQEIKYIAKE